MLYVENDRDDRSAELIACSPSATTSFGTRRRSFSANNFFQNPVNEFGNVISANMLAIHSSMPSDIAACERSTVPESNPERRSNSKCVITA